MNRNLLRRGLARCLFAVLVLPVALAVVIGLGGLLAALGDGAGAAVCVRVSLALGALFVIAVVAATTCNALAILAPPARRRRHRRPRRRPRAATVSDHHGGPP